MARAIVPIAYGCPRPEQLEEALLGRVSLGGCITRVFEVNGKEISFDPDWHCSSCEHKWQDESKKATVEESRDFIAAYSNQAYPQ